MACKSLLLEQIKRIEQVYDASRREGESEPSVIVVTVTPDDVVGKHVARVYGGYDAAELEHRRQQQLGTLCVFAIKREGMERLVRACNPAANIEWLQENADTHFPVIILNRGWMLVATATKPSRETCEPHA